MLYHAQNASILGMDYVRFGNGEKALIVIPGLGDGLLTLKGTALPFALVYGHYAEGYTLYGISRRRDLPHGYTTWEMADDIAAAMDALAIGEANIVGISQGGMIAQHLALRHAQKVSKLVLAVTLARQNETIQAVVRRWMELARAGDYRRIVIETADKSYGAAYLRRRRWLYALAGSFLRPKSPERYLTMTEACLQHDGYDMLERISCPVLVIGGGQDRIVGCAAADEVAGRIPGSKLYIYPHLGHGLYAEARDFPQRVLDFFAQ